MNFELFLEDEQGNVLEIEPPSTIEVTEQLGQPITFTLTFAEDICKGEYKLLNHQALDPLQSINIAVKRKGQSAKWYLVKGFIQGHQITIMNGGQGSQLRITGSDNSARLSWVEEKWRWPERLKDDDILFLLTKVAVRKGKKLEDIKERKKPFNKYRIAKHPNYDELLEVEYKIAASKQGTEVANRKNGMLQSSDDLSFIQRLGRQTCRYFWISYDEDGKEVANFRKLPLKDKPEITLDVSGKKNNIDQLNINWDIDRPTAVKNRQPDPTSGEKKREADTDGAPQHKLASRPENAVTLQELTDGHIEAYISSPSTDAKNMKDKSEAALNEAEWFIRASCTTTFERLCKYQELQSLQKGNQRDIKPIHAHTIVKVKGAGRRYDGPYLVSSVTHSIDAVSYEIQIQLQRNAWERTPE